MSDAMRARGGRRRASEPKTREETRRKPDRARERSRRASGPGREMHARVGHESGAPPRHLDGAAKVMARVLRVSVLLVGGAYLTYLVAMNAFLSTALFEMVVAGNPSTLDIHYDRGWSLRPGRVHANGL